MTKRALVLLALIVLGLGLVATVTPATPAWACSCVGHGQDERAELIVVGTVTEVTDTGVRLAVESVVKGSLQTATPLRLAVGRDGNACGYEFRAGLRYRVNSTAGATGICSGIQDLPAASLSALSAAPVAAPVSREPSATGGWLTAGAVLAALGAGFFGMLRWRRRTGTSGT